MHVYMHIYMYVCRLGQSNLGGRGRGNRKRVPVSPGSDNTINITPSRLWEGEWRERNTVGREEKQLGVSERESERNVEGKGKGSLGTNPYSNLSLFLPPPLPNATLANRKRFYNRLLYYKHQDVKRIKKEEFLLKEKV